MVVTLHPLSRALSAPSHVVVKSERSSVCCLVSRLFWRGQAMWRAKGSSNCRERERG